MRADSVGAPVTPQQWDYIHEMGGALRTSLDNVTAVFAPSCIGHSVLTKRDWLHVKIDDISLAQALRCWELSTRHGKEHARRASDGKKKRNKQQQQLQQLEPQPQQQQRQLQRKNEKLESQSDEIERCRERRRRNRERNRNRIDGGQQHRERHQQRRRNMSKEERQRRRKNLRCKNLATRSPITASAMARSERSPLLNDHSVRGNNKNTNRFNNEQRLSNKVPRNETELANNSHRRNNGHKRRRNRNQDQNHKPKKPIGEPQKCSLRLLERCSWPQCNHSCPTLTNPLTGEEMRFLELLASFGLDIEAVATALGVDMQTLNNMEHAELVNLLTQQTS